MQNTFMNKMLQRIADAVEHWTGGSITIDVTGAGDMQGATSTSAGVHGLVPAPAAGDEHKVLEGSGAWVSAAGGVPDYGTIITSGAYNLYDGLSYTATQNCFIVIMIGCSSSNSYPSVSVNNTQLGYVWFQSTSQGVELPLMIPLKAGDTLDVSATTQGSNWSESYTIFSL